MIYDTWDALNDQLMHKGRILNRFTKDMGIIDEQLPLAAYDLNLVSKFFFINPLSTKFYYLI